MRYGLEKRAGLQLFSCLVLILANDGPSKISRDFSEGPLFSLSPIENSCSRQLRSP